MKPVDWMIVFILAAFAGMGVGTGGLLVIWFTLNGRMEQIAAQGLNLAFFVISCAASLFFHLRNRKIYPEIVFPAMIAGVVGTFFGTYAANLLGGAVLRRIFGFILTFAGVWSVVKLLKKVKFSKKLQKSK